VIMVKFVSYQLFFVNLLLINLTNNLFDIGPGAMILLPNPPGTDRFLLNSSTPILMPSRPIVVIKSNHILNDRAIYSEGTDLNGFILNDCTINARSFEVRNTKCGGNMCDRQQDNISKCACYQMTNRSGNVIIAIEVTVSTPNGNFFLSKIRSKWFLETYIYSAVLQAGTRASAFEDYEVEDNFFQAIESVLDYINRTCKFRIIGWVKRGEIIDQGVEQPNTYNAHKILVQSGSLNHHITRVDPMKPHLIEKRHLKSLKFNTVDDFIV